jgi:hypothetical protein
MRAMLARTGRRRLSPCRGDRILTPATIVERTRPGLATRRTTDVATKTETTLRLQYAVSATIERKNGKEGGACPSWPEALESVTDPRTFLGPRLRAGGFTNRRCPGEGAA